ncbi:MAG: hypothetical protein ACFE0I_06430 [Elainellaceae cyanobacterium]
MKTTNMQGFGSAFSKISVVLIGLALMGGSCRFNKAPEPARTLQIHQSWELQPGDTLGGHQITGGLGDISIDLGGDRVFAPFDGTVQPYSGNSNCVIFSSPEVPAYLFRLCGLRQSNQGELRQGDSMGSGDYLQFATLRRQPDGTWAMVEPSSSILEKILTSP